MHPIQEIVAKQKQGIPAGIASYCTANANVLKAVIKRSIATDTYALVEATANQVNQFGGYTGMTPEAFYRSVVGIAKECGLDEQKLILGGDHLGPLIWCGLDESEAMLHAERMVYEYARAGFSKIHLDTSMRLNSDPIDEVLSDRTIALRGARLCAQAEKGYRDRLAEFPHSPAPVYIIGSEVPIPGGAQEAEDNISITKADACLQTYDTYRVIFEEHGLHEAWERVVGLVVQPGVEFSDTSVFLYDRCAAIELTGALKSFPMVFEGHSTDYQTAASLKNMVEDGIAILKVGPALTFAYREALFALELIEKEMLTGKGLHMSGFRDVLENAMLCEDSNWKKHYHGDGNIQKFARAFSFSDRARYYLPVPEVDEAVQRLVNNLRQSPIPLTLLSQYMPMQYNRVRNGVISNDPLALALDRIGDCIDDYIYATVV